MNTALFDNRMRYMTFVLSGFVAFQFCQVSRADEFKLKDGRTLVGQLEGAPKKDAQQWTVKLPSGTLVRFPSSQLEINGHVKTDERIEKYKQSLQNVEPTAESHSALAGWCKSNGLKEQSLAHYRRALDFNSDFAIARAGLGYTKDGSGRWVERDEFMTEGKGKVKINGKYVYPEVHAFNEAKKALQEKTKEWEVVIKRLQSAYLSKSSNSQKSLAELLQINDPFAVPALGKYLMDAKTPRDLKMQYVQMLSQFQLPEAVGALVQATLVEDDTQIRDACLDSLLRFGREYAIASYIGVLREISSKTQDGPATTEQLNRAAVGLNALKAEIAVLPLIEALVTKYKMTVTPQGNYNVAQGLVTPGKPVTTIESAQNPHVLSALTSLTRQNFSYDEQRWLNWYASVYAAPMGDLRRDP
jgi:tetratricopeptide (TPR) repeat protein